MWMWHLISCFRCLIEVVTVICRGGGWGGDGKCGIIMSFDRRRCIHWTMAYNYFQKIYTASWAASWLVSKGRYTLTRRSDRFFAICSYISLAGNRAVRQLIRHVAYYISLDAISISLVATDLCDLLLATYRHWQIASVWLFSLSRAICSKRFKPSYLFVIYRAPFFTTTVSLAGWEVGGHVYVRNM